MLEIYLIICHSAILISLLVIKQELLTFNFYSYFFGPNDHF